mmetsp:Transcript_14664/g.39670  ORF Transcript_14664/g.39670 Transcript_14664/m.39670 type:complete len:208 (-) Transcript_14664:128-751(-)
MGGGGGREQVGEAAGHADMGVSGLAESPLPASDCPPSICARLSLRPWDEGSGCVGCTGCCMELSRADTSMAPRTNLRCGAGSGAPTPSPPAVPHLLTAPETAAVAAAAGTEALGPSGSWASGAAAAAAAMRCACCAAAAPAWACACMAMAWRAMSASCCSCTGTKPSSGGCCCIVPLGKWKNSSSPWPLSKTCCHSIAKGLHESRYG